MENPHILRNLWKILDAVGQISNITDGKEYCPACERYGDHLDTCMAVEQEGMKAQKCGCEWILNPLSEIGKNRLSPLDRRPDYISAGCPKHDMKAKEGKVGK